MRQTFFGRGIDGLLGRAHSGISIHARQRMPSVGCVGRGVGLVRSADEYADEQEDVVFPGEGYVPRRISQADRAREGRSTAVEFDSCQELDSCQEERFPGDSYSTVGCDVSEATSVDVYCSEEEVAKIQELAEERAEAALALASRKLHAACSALPASLAPGSAAQACAPEPLSSTGCPRPCQPLSSTGHTVSKGPTLMIRNIACRYCRGEVAVILDEAGLEGTYTFINVPMNLRRPKSSNLGYAFVGFKSEESADTCWRLFSGKTFGRSATHKRCEVAPAYDQNWMLGSAF